MAHKLRRRITMSLRLGRLFTHHVHHVDARTHVRIDERIMIYRSGERHSRARATTTGMQMHTTHTHIHIHNHTQSRPRITIKSVCPVVKSRASHISLTTATTILRQTAGRRRRTPDRAIISLKMHYFIRTQCAQAHQHTLQTNALLDRKPSVKRNDTRMLIS